VRALTSISSLVALHFLEAMELHQAVWPPVAAPVMYPLAKDE